MERLFGTDGIRGRAFVAPLDEDTVRRLGVALADELESAPGGPSLLLAGDTRASTPTLAAWLGEAFQGAGGTLTWAGVLPTPAVSHLLRGGRWSAGVVISASHNPAEDNGIKVLDRSGQKIADASEHRLERRLTTSRAGAGATLPLPDPSHAETYLELVAASHSAKTPLAGMHVVVDAAHGAASGIARRLLERLGARVTAIASAPDGANINRGCGAIAPAALQAAVRETHADAGLALDGDADRAVLVDERGRLLDGDDLLLAWARHLAQLDRLPQRRVVATVMSNFGLERALAVDGIATLRCDVGDRSVWLAMREHGAALGGEQSGHVICCHHSVSGDGLITGSHLLAIAVASGRPVSALSNFERLPQVLLNVPVTRRRPFAELPGVARALAGVESTLDGRGRVLLRYSGTEPVARVMLEGDDRPEIETLAADLANAVALELG